jgi:hypothetical protein
MFYADKHHDDYQFLDIFESSIGDLVIDILPTLVYTDTE